MPTSPVAIRGKKDVPPALVGAPRPLASNPFVAGSVMKFGRFGLAKLGWLSMLKNSARNVSLTRSVMGVSLKTEKLNSLKVGPRRMLRPMSPKCRVPAWQLLSPEDELAVVLPNVQGTWKEERSTPNGPLP